MIDVMDTTTKTAPLKFAGSPMYAAPEAVREMAERRTTQAKATCEKMIDATTQATDLIKTEYSAAVRGIQDYNYKLLEFAQTNTSVAFAFAQKLFGVKSPSEFVELSAEHARNQSETLSKQVKELTVLGQKITLAAIAPQDRIHPRCLN
jgi:phasin